MPTSWWRRAGGPPSMQRQMSMNWKANIWLWLDEKKRKAIESQSLIDEPCNSIPRREVELPEWKCAKASRRPLSDIFVGSSCRCTLLYKDDKGDEDTCDSWVVLGNQGKRCIFCFGAQISSSSCFFSVSSHFSKANAATVSPVAATNSRGLEGVTGSSKVTSRCIYVIP